MNRTGPGWRALLGLLARLPQPALSRAFGRLTDVRIPRPLRAPMLGAFARFAGIDIDEAEHPLAEYPSLDAFFVRRLRPGLRTWPADPGTAGSPVDGVLGQCGVVHEGRLLQAKGRDYTAAALLGEPADAERYQGGSFITIYLSPRHYHRIHAPCGGAIPMARHVPGALMPVNRHAVDSVPDLFPRNERLIAFLDGALGRVAIVAVGAWNVGRISTAFDAGWGDPAGRVTNRRTRVAETRAYAPARRVERGEELMAFHLGSTVVLLFEPGRAVLAGGLDEGADVRLGQAFALGVI